jgi:hypothetical protein
MYSNNKTLNIFSKHHTDFLIRNLRLFIRKTNVFLRLFKYM